LRRLNPRRVKVHRSYTVEEVAKLFGVHENAVRNWLKSGLPKVDERRPILILGRQLASFLHVRRELNRQRCRAGEFYCFHCRAPRRPVERAAEYLPLTAQSGNLKATCTNCGTRMYRRVSLSKLAAIAGDLQIQMPLAEERIGDCPDPSPNCDLTQEPETYANAEGGMRKLSGMLGHWREVRADPIRVVQDALSDVATMSLSSMTTALDAIVEQNLWRQDRPFESFGDFAVSFPPLGLGVRALAPLRVLRHALLDAGNFALWTEILERVARQRGRPRKRLVNDEDFVPFYTIPTAATARDRLLLALKRHHPGHFSAVCDCRISPRAAAIDAGLIAIGSSRFGGACNIKLAAALSQRAQGRLLCELFKVMSANAQCALIARALEPRLGFGLAERWREDLARSSGS